MKKFFTQVLSLALALSLYACDNNDTSTTTNPSGSISSDTTNIFTEPATEPLTFVLTAGEYGKLITYNKGSEFEESFYAYYIPEGSYTVTNKGKYMRQVSVYSNETHIKEDGWQEAESFDVSNSDTISVGADQHILIAEPSVFVFVQQ